MELFSFVNILFICVFTKASKVFFICDIISLFPILLFTLINDYDGVSFPLSMSFFLLLLFNGVSSCAFTHGVGVTIKK